MVESLVINIDWLKGSYTGIQTSNRTYLLDYLSGWECPFPLTVTMPCGESIIFNSEIDISENPLPCSCGRLDHWFIKYTDGSITNE